MAWQEYQFKLTSSAPLLMHNGQSADPLNKWAKLRKPITSKRKKTDADHEELGRLDFLSSLYLGEEGPILPTYVIEAMVLSGAKKSKEGTLAKSGCVCTKHARLEYVGPRTAEGLWADASFQHISLVRIGTDRTRRVRPIFREWSAVITLEVNVSDVVNLSQVEKWLVDAGEQVGLCDWRPQFGRFTVERL